MSEHTIFLKCSAHIIMALCTKLSAISFDARTSVQTGVEEVVR